MPWETEHSAKLRDALIEGVLARVPGAALTGHPTQRLPNNASFVVRYIEGESMLLNLDFEGFAVSSGSACTSGSLEPSHVLLAIGLSHEVSHGSIRISVGRGTMAGRPSSSVSADRHSNDMSLSPNRPAGRRREEHESSRATDPVPD
jgi:cysteine sulfinate desulfinase/cysteine desulfurase-like protein